MEYWFIYLLQIFEYVDGIRVALLVILFLSAIGLSVLGFLTGFRFENFKPQSCIDISAEVAQATTKFFKKTIIWTSIVSLFIFMIPTQQTLLLLGGTYLGKKAINAVVTDEKIKKVNEIISLELDKRIKELKEGK